MIDKLLPAGVVCRESITDVGEDWMLPAEAAVISKATAKRRREFGTVRHCARQALAELGIPPAPLLPGPDREPRWPPGVVGSLTHCAGYRAAAVARDTELASLGIDAEPHAPLPSGVLAVVSRDTERARLAVLAAERPQVHWDRVLFCAKESVYKAWFPLARCWLGFEDAEVTLLPDGSWHAEVLVPGPVRSVAGRWLVESGLVLTAVWVAERQPGR